MKRFIAILMCTAILFGSVAGVSYANEDLREPRQRRENPSNYGRMLKGFVKTFDENEYPIISEITDVKEENKEIRDENKSLKEQLKTMLKQAKEQGIQLEEVTKEMLKNAREGFRAEKELSEEYRAQLEAMFDYSDIEATVQEAIDDEDLFNDITSTLLDALHSFNNRIDNRNDILQELVDIVSNEVY